MTRARFSRREHPADDGTKKTRTPFLVLPGIGAGIGLAVAALAFQMAGAGHGWTSAFVSASALLFAPAAGLALALRGSRAGFRLAVVLVVLALAADYAIAHMTLEEGTSYAANAWERAPGLVALWAGLWLSWQLALIPPLLRRSGGRVGG